MKEFFKVFLLFAIFGFFMFLSIVITAIMTYYISLFLSINLNDWGRVMSCTIWFCFAGPLTAAILNKISDHFLNDI